MNDESKKGSDSSIDWSERSSSLSTDAPIDWGKSSAGPVEPPSRPRPAERPPETVPELEQEPEQADPSSESVPRPSARRRPELSVRPGSSALLAPTRSPLAALTYLAFGGYLLLVAFLCYQGLGLLHGKAAAASSSQLDSLQVDHRQIAHLMLLNLAAAVSFLLGAVLLLARKRGAGLCLGLVGIAAAIYLLYWSLGEGRSYLREADLLVKVIAIALVAWFRPRASSQSS